VIAITAASNAASRRVMQKLGMRHEAALDFDHPDVADGHFARRHVTYVMQRPCTKQTA
jgi:RimJ/RimL family protein N-acetyltransferase